MRLYMNEREARLVKACLLNEMVMLSENQKNMANKLLERIDLCTQLQKSENKSKPACREGPEPLTLPGGPDPSHLIYRRLPI